MGKELTDAVCRYVESNLEELISEDDLFSRCDPTDEESARNALERKVEQLIEDFGVSFDSWDVGEVSNAYELEKHAQSYMDANQPWPPRRSGSGPVMVVIRRDDIDDLFDRR